MEAAREQVPTDVEAEAPEARQPWQKTLWLIARLFLGLLALLAVVAFLGSLYRAELEAFGKSFVARFGIYGMTLGTFLADGFHFPVPPQFYMLLAIADGGSQAPAFAAIAVGSLFGGAAGFFLARHVARVPWLARWLARSTRSARGLFVKYGYRAVVIASMSPVAYSVLCYAAGIYQMPKRVLVIISVLRIPRLVLFYYLVRLGWSL